MKIKIVTAEDLERMTLAAGSLAGTNADGVKLGSLRVDYMRLIGEVWRLRAKVRRQHLPDVLRDLPIMPLPDALARADDNRGQLNREHWASLNVNRGRWIEDEHDRTNHLLDEHGRLRERVADLKGEATAMRDAIREWHAHWPSPPSAAALRAAGLGAVTFVPTELELRRVALLEHAPDIANIAVQLTGDEDLLEEAEAAGDGGEEGFDSLVRVAAIALVCIARAVQKEASARAATEPPILVAEQRAFGPEAPGVVAEADAARARSEEVSHG